MRGRIEVSAASAPQGNLATRMSAPKPSRRAAVAPFMAMDVLRAARKLEREGRRIIHMELGEPGAPTPRRMLDVATAVLRDGAPGYGEAAGDPQLRARIARHYREHYGVELSPERVMVTTGSSGAFLLAFISAFDAGARIGVAAPGYPAYLNILEALGLVPVVIEIGEDTRFAPTAALVEATHRRARLDGLLLMSPANPTGAMISSEELERIAGFCAEAGVTLVADEIYHGLEYVAPAHTALRFSREAIVVNSFSKYYAMTGWRLGWIVGPESRSSDRAAAAVARDLRADSARSASHWRLSRRARSWRRSRRAMRRAARGSSSGFLKLACRVSRRPTAPSTSLRMSRI